MQRENTWLYEVNASPDLNERSQVTEVTKGKEAPRINNPIFTLPGEGLESQGLMGPASSTLFVDGSLTGVNVIMTSAVTLQLCRQFFFKHLSHPRC